MKELKYSVQAVILNDKNEILAVSRKNDHNDFGLVGGKKDSCDYLLEDAMIRETKEETGLIIKRNDLIPIFSMHKHGYMGITYLVTNWFGEIKTDEPHVVKWTSIEEVEKGMFGDWNKLVHQSLKSMGVEVYSEREQNVVQMMKDSEELGLYDMDFNENKCRNPNCPKESQKDSKFCNECFKPL